MRKILILSLLLLVAALPVAAQSLTGTVAGVVKDEQGGVLPGVTVTLIGKTGNRATTTDAEGAFRFAAVNPGTYAITTELSGFRTKRQDNVDVGIGKMADINFTLGVGGVTETVDVVGESPVVDVASSSTDNTLSQDMLFNLPIRPDNAATDLMNYLPGINSGSAYGGNEDYGNALLVDGVDTRDPEAGSAWTFFSFNIVEEVQVGGLGANAEYGSYTGRDRQHAHQVGRQPLRRPLRRVLHERRPVRRQRVGRGEGGQPVALRSRRPRQAAGPQRPALRPDHQGQAVLLRERPAVRDRREPERPAHEPHRGEPPLQRQADLAAGAERQRDGQLPVGLLQRYRARRP